MKQYSEYGKELLKRIKHKDFKEFCSLANLQ